MSSGQGWFESDVAYRARIDREANEQTIESLGGSPPSMGWFESDDAYRDRIAEEANELRIESGTGATPSQGWFESSDSYRERIEREANEVTIEESTGSFPSQGWFESDQAYAVRIRREANQHIVENDSGATPSQGWFEGDHAYRSRIAHEARLARLEADSGYSSPEYGSSENSTIVYSCSEPSSPSQSGGFGLGWFIVGGVILFAIASISNRDENTSAVNSSSHPASERSSGSYSGSLSQRIVGSWLERKIVTFYGDGTWALQRHEQAPYDREGRLWSISDNTLTRGTPSFTVKEKILSLNEFELVLQDQDGNIHRHTRVR